MQKKYHILALGGMGMSAVARLLNQKGHIVTGEDKNRSLLLDLLEKEGIYSSEKISLSKDTTLVYSTAIKEDHPQLVKAKENNLKVSHRTEILNELLEDKTSLLVTGAHGKTTTSSLLAFVLDCLNSDPSFALGGILQGKKTNAKVGKGKYFVAEADESDGSFLNLTCDYALITNIEEDHLEFWKNKERIIKGYQTFCKQAKKMKFFCLDCPQIASLNLNGISYGLSNKAQVFATDIVQKNGYQLFTIESPMGVFKEVKLHLLGDHNIQNALGVFSMLTYLGFDPKKIIEALSSFSGVKRRMEKVIDRKDLTLIDDYAHHPTEIHTTLEGLKKQALARRVVAVFQPHRANRFNEFYKEFCSCFTHADKVIVTDVYQVGGFEDVNLDEFAKKLGQKATYICIEDLLDHLKKEIRPFDVVITLGAGDINKVLEPLSKVEKKLHVALLYGGPSLENKVAIDSAKTFYEGLDQEFYQTETFYLDKNKTWYKASKFDHHSMKEISIEELVSILRQKDVCIPSFHGPFGEDGTIQGFLETIGVNYTSPSPLSCALSMHKGLSKRIAQSVGIKTAKWIEVKKNYNKQEVLKSLKSFTYPLYIKPCSLGSTYGVNQVSEEKDLFSFIDKTLEYEGHILVEETLVGQEIEVGIIGDTYLEVGRVAKVPIGDTTYTYSKKYGSTAVAAEIPAKIEPELYNAAIKAARKIYRTFEITSHARIDFFIVNNEIYFNEINPIPGMTKTSAFPYMYEKSIQNLVNDLVVCSLEEK